MELVIDAMQKMVIIDRFIERRPHPSTASNLPTLTIEAPLEGPSGIQPRAWRILLHVHVSFRCRLPLGRHPSCCSTTSLAFPNGARRPTWKERCRHPWLRLPTAQRYRTSTAGAELRLAGGPCHSCDCQGQ